MSTKLFYRRRGRDSVSALTRFRSFGLATASRSRKLAGHRSGVLIPRASKAVCSLLFLASLRFAAEREGFEPSRPVRAYRFSRAAHSTTLVPLQFTQRLVTRALGSPYFNPK